MKKKLFLLGTITIIWAQNPLYASVDAMDKPTALKILELPEGASKDQILKAFRKLTLQYYPDKVLQNLPANTTEEIKKRAIKEAEEKVKEIGAAKEILTRDDNERDAVQTWFNANKDAIKNFIRNYFGTQPLKYDSNLLFALNDWREDDTIFAQPLQSERNDFIASEIRTLLEEMQKSTAKVDISQMTEAQIKAIPLDTIRDFTIEDVEALSSVAALTIDQTQALNPSIITNLSYDIAQFSTDQIKAFTAAQIAAITADQILFLNKEQIQNLDISKITTNTLKLLTQNKTAGKIGVLTDNQIKSLNTDQIMALLHELTEDQINTLTIQQMNNFKEWQKLELTRHKERLLQRKQEREKKERRENEERQRREEAAARQETRDRLAQPVREWFADNLSPVESTIRYYIHDHPDARTGEIINSLHMSFPRMHNLDQDIIDAKLDEIVQPIITEHRRTSALFNEQKANLEAHIKTLPLLTKPLGYWIDSANSIITATLSNQYDALSYYQKDFFMVLVKGLITQIYNQKKNDQPPHPQAKQLATQALELATCLRR